MQDTMKEFLHKLRSGVRLDKIVMAICQRVLLIAADLDLEAFQKYC